MLDSLPGVPVPDLDDPMYAPYWAGTEQHELVLPSCAQCQRVNWPPRAACPGCSCPRVNWQAHEPSGTLFTWTVVHHPTAPGFQNVPYTVAVVDLRDAPGTRLLGNVVGQSDQLTIDAPVDGVFRSAGPGGELTVLCWRLSGD